MSAAPVWKPGYEWAFRYESPVDSGTYVWSVDREEAILDGRREEHAIAPSRRVANARWEDVGVLNS